MKKQSLKIGLALLLSLSLFGCSKEKTNEDSKPSDSPEVAFATRDDVNYQTVEAPETERENGVISAEEWSKAYPEIYATYMATSDNNYITSYIEEDPYLVNIYEGFGFAKDYNSAQGHAYSLEDVSATVRPHALANCLTCKTADYTALVNALGVEAYSYDFEETFAKTSENVGCYTCHANEAGNEGKLVVTHDYIINGLGDQMDSIDAAVLSCGQCHIEYYFAKDTKATTIPYSSVEEMTPEAMLAYYNEIGFADWTQESTGTKLLKAQHPEMETYLNGSVHASLGMSCADCHMATETAENGTVYISHNLVSPLASESILNTCTTCHGDTDMEAKIKDIQKAVVARETEVGNKLSDLNDHLTDAVASNNYTEEELDAIRDLYRSAQWFFDYDYVENAEGAHNSKLAYSCLDTAEDYINQAEALFK